MRYCSQEVNDNDKIDLHTHSNYSDGTDSPAELIRKAKQQGLSWVALTDHDTNLSWEPARKASEEYGINLLVGTEVSTKLRDISVHLLAYGYRPGEELDDLMATARASRIERLQQLTANISADYPLKWEDVKRQVAGKNTTLGRPHLADALVEAGYFPDRNAAFAGPLSTRAKYYVSYWAPTPVEAIKAVKAAGGFSVIAHAFSLTRHVHPHDCDIAQMVAAGLGGMEKDHRDHGPEERKHVKELCQKYGLVMTGSSDYHGAGKPNCLGENTTTPQMLRRILEALDK
ncbi:PHP domain-containing protein [Actinomycetaceae bacterium TAE3-ERU4]|nr:PHP domain-containing protein [Actinomycetaceae bacterium TAE3-ERU4]